MTSTAIVVTGLPASGKTTVALAIAEWLGWPILDKDEYLERLFEENDVASPEMRRRLSIESDTLFQSAACKLQNAVLVSHWRPRIGPSDTGTPTQWVTEHYKNILEVFCRCSKETAVGRFRNRKRHPGHLDKLKREQDVEQQFQTLIDGYPLEFGQRLTVDTEHLRSYGELLDQIDALLRTKQMN